MQIAGSEYMYARKNCILDNKTTVLQSYLSFVLTYKVFYFGYK